MKQVILGDCLDAMSRLPSGSVDMVLCDLPYGTTKHKWDVVIPFDDLWGEYNRIVKPNGAVVLTGAFPFTMDLIASNRDACRVHMVWVKNTVTNHLNAKRQPMRAHEDVLVFYREQPTYNPPMMDGRHMNDVLRFDSQHGAHPTTKPVPLMEHLIRMYTDPGDTVLDNCMGSGTTPVAAIRTGRGYIGIERDETFHAIAMSRIGAAHDYVAMNGVVVP